MSGWWEGDVQHVARGRAQVLRRVEQGVVEDGELPLAPPDALPGHRERGAHGRHAQPEVGDEPPAGADVRPERRAGGLRIIEFTAAAARAADAGTLPLRGRAEQRTFEFTVAAARGLGTDGGRTEPQPKLSLRPFFARFRG